MTRTRFLTRDEAYKRILDLILADEIDPDEPLSERSLAEQLGIGRMPVREAIRALACDGVLEVLPARGTFVRQINHEQLRELYEIRQTIEGLAAYLAAERGPTPELLAYGAKFTAAKVAQPPRDYAQLYGEGADFHVEVFRAARNKLLLELYHPIRMRFRVTFGLARHHDNSWVVQSAEEHLTILHAIVARDPDAAQRLMRDHLARSYELTVAILTRLHKGAGLLAEPPVPSKRLARGAGH